MSKWIVLLMVLGCLKVQAKEVVDTLKSTKSDRVIVSYDVAFQNGQLTIKFLDARKKLGSTFNGKYELDEVAVVFFDRTGNYGERMKFTGISTEAVMVPYDMQYKISRDGYFLVGDTPTITLNVNSDKPSPLSIPIFLAHYEGKRHYKVFSRLEDLVVSPSVRKESVHSEAVSNTIVQTVTSQEEVETGLTEEEEAAILIERIETLLEKQDNPEFSFELKQAISGLSNLKVKDRRLSAQINEVLKACSQKEKELRDDSQREEERKVEEAVILIIERIKTLLEEQDGLEFSSDLIQARSELSNLKVKDNRLSAQKDEVLKACREKERELKEKARRKAEEEKKQNRLLMIGGVILALLTFVGGKVFQHFQNEKKEKRFSDMQEAAIKKAEAESKKRARDMVQNQVYRAKSESRKAVRNAYDEAVEKNLKGKLTAGETPAYQGSKVKGNKKIRI